MTTKNVAVIQSFSCFGKSSLSVAIPILSAAGLSTAAIPTVLLSTHTGGYGVPEKTNLDEFLEPAIKHWHKCGLTFDGIYTGYIRSENQVDALIKYIELIKKENSLFLCDPAFGDNGRLYSGFSDDFPAKMLELCKKADIITPNLTEACLLTGIEYKTGYSEDYIENLLNKLNSLTNTNVIITGINLSNDKITSAVISEGNISYISAEKIPVNYHGTGDIFASCLIGGLLKGKNLNYAISTAMEFVSLTLSETVIAQSDERIGIMFENQLSNLIKLLN